MQYVQERNEAAGCIAIYRDSKGQPFDPRQNGQLVRYLLSETQISLQFHDGGNVLFINFILNKVLK